MSLWISASPAIAATGWKAHGLENSRSCYPIHSVTVEVEIFLPMFHLNVEYNWFSEICYSHCHPFFCSMQPARLSIFFKEHQFITSKRSELYGQTDFLANCGGLLGLFMGVSVLSIIEVVYYCTLRLGCTLRIRKTKKQRRNAIAPESSLPCIQIDSADDKKHHQC